MIILLGALLAMGGFGLAFFLGDHTSPHMNRADWISIPLVLVGTVIIVLFL